ncbi:TcdA/TcdB catalytic glycosyltransferase domain-containing protein [Kitasatospora sp. NPDC085879]|uniref:TcdA/TcdB catalytic glycosyltransferase domain-containing protein n=1 Tax=Kitasatospora sp. NPDC085879 TaxID=3154769 RepID=UPI00341A7A54
MSLNIPSWAHPVMGILVGHWPTADEDGMRDAATVFDQLAWDADALHGQLSAQSVHVPGWRGESRDAHDRGVGHVLGNSGLAQTRESAARLADSIRTARGQVVKAKVQDLEIAAWLLASTAWALASAYITGGASLQLLAVLQTAAEELLAAVSRWLLAAVKAIAGGVLFMVAADASAQGIELLRGDIDTFDLDSLAQSAIGGAVVGAVSLPLGLVVRPAGEALKNTLGALLGKSAGATAERAVGFANMVATNWVTNAGLGAAQGKANLSLADAVAGAGSAALHVHGAPHGESVPAAGHRAETPAPRPGRGEDHFGSVAWPSTSGEGWGVGTGDGHWLEAVGEGNWWVRPDGWGQAPQDSAFAAAVRAIPPAADGRPRLVVGTPDLPTDAVLHRLAPAWQNVKAAGVTVSEVVLASPIGERGIAAVREFAAREQVKVTAPNGQVVASPDRSLFVPSAGGSAGTSTHGQWLHVTPRPEHMHAPAAPSSHPAEAGAQPRPTPHPAPESRATAHTSVRSDSPLVGRPDIPRQAEGASVLPTTTHNSSTHESTGPGTPQQRAALRYTPPIPSVERSSGLHHLAATTHQTVGVAGEPTAAVPRPAPGPAHSAAAPNAPGHPVHTDTAPLQTHPGTTVRVGGAVLDPPRWERALPEGDRGIQELADRLAVDPVPPATALHEPMPARGGQAGHEAAPAVLPPHRNNGEVLSARALADVLDPTGHYGAGPVLPPDAVPGGLDGQPEPPIPGHEQRPPITPDTALPSAPAGTSAHPTPDRLATPELRHTEQDMNGVAPTPPVTTFEGSGQLRAALSDDFDPSAGAAVPSTALARILGPDVFGLRQAPPAPDFLHGYDFARIKADQRSALYQALDLTHEAPRPADLVPSALEHRPDWVAASQQQWVSRTDTPWLPKRPKIPHTLHSIWLGGPLRDEGAMHVFRENVGAAARGLTDFDVVMWTDVPREQFDAARSLPMEPGTTAQLAEVRSMLDWAQENDVRLVNVDEVFSAGTPMELQALYRTEMAKQIGPGYAAASDILRIEILRRFGGVYSDGDNILSADLGAELLRVANSPQGFAVGTEMGRNTNAVLISPAGHHFLDAYQQAMADNYTRTPYENALRNGALMVGHRDALVPADPDRALAPQIRPQNPQAVRTEVLHRTGPSPNVFEPLAAALDLATRTHLPRVAEDVFTVRSDHSWLPDGQAHETIDARPAAPTAHETVQVARKLLASLVHELHSQPGNLNLARYAPVAEQHGAPGTVWDAVIGMIAADPHLRDMVDSVTLDVLDANNRPMRTVDLPPYARDLLGVTDRAGSDEQILPAGTFPAHLREPGASWESRHTDRSFDAQEGVEQGRDRGGPQPVSDRTRTLLGTGGHGLAGLLFNHGAPARAELLGRSHGLVLRPGLSHSLLDKIDLVLRELPRADVADNPELASIFVGPRDLGQSSAYIGEQRGIAVVRPLGMPAWLYTRLDRGVVWQRQLMDYGALQGHEGISAREDKALELGDRRRDVMAGVSDVLAHGNLVEWTLRHEVGHAVDQQISWVDRFSSQEIFGGWRLHPTFAERRAIAWDILRSVGVSDAEAGLKDEYGMSMVEAFATVLNPPSLALHRQGKDLRNVFHQFGGGLRDKGEQALRRVRLALAEPWTFSDGGGADLSIDGRIYQVSSQDGWISYLADQRRYAVSNYQFATPSEWFAEAYAAFHDPAPGPRERLNPQVREWFSRRLSPTAEAPSSEAAAESGGNTLADHPAEPVPIRDRPVEPAELALDRAVVRFARGDKAVTPAARTDLIVLADQLAHQGLERWKRGLPLPEIDVVGYGNGKRFPVPDLDQASRTGYERAVAVTDVLKERLVGRLAELQPDASDVLTADRFPIKERSAGTGADEGIGGAVPHDTRTRRRAVVSVDYQPHQVVIGDASRGAELVPRELHFVWLGGTLSEAARGNVDAWLAKAGEAGWHVNMWADRGAMSANADFFAGLAAAGAKVTSVDAELFAHLDSAVDPGPSPARKPWDLYSFAVEHKAFAMASDITRYALLHREGGVYLDVDLGPGRAELPDALTMPADGIPFFAPQIHDWGHMEQILRNNGWPSAGAGGVDGHEALSAAVEAQYKRGNFGNNLIVTQPRSAFLKGVLESLPDPNDPVFQARAKDMRNDAASVTGPWRLMREVERFLGASGEWPAGAKWATLFDSRRVAFDPGQRRWWDGLEWLTAESENQETTPVPTPTPALEPPAREPSWHLEVVPSPTDEERLAAAAEAQQWVWRSEKGTLWRNDDRESAVVSAAGFQSMNPAKLNLPDHVMNSGGSNGHGFVSTSREKRLSREANYQYMVKASGGADVNRALPGHQHKGEMEIAFPGGIGPRYIKGTYDLDPDGMPTGWIPNPGYVSINGPGQLAKIMKWFG